MDALEPNAARASPVIAAAVSREPVYRAFIMAAFWVRPNDKTWAGSMEYDRLVRSFNRQGRHFVPSRPRHWLSLPANFERLRPLNQDPVARARL